jgi:hypothetical protein
MASWSLDIFQVFSDRFRSKPKSITKYLKNIQITVNKPVLNSEYNQNNFVVYHQNIRGLSNKTDELSVFINNIHTPHILCLTEHHMKTPDILQVNLENYTQGASYCRQNMAKGGVSIFVRNNLKFNQLRILHHCNEQDIECSVVQLES